VEKIIADRRLMGQGKMPVDLGDGENLAYASLLKDGFAVRFSGRNSGRGTFFHRHAVLHDQNREKWDSGSYVPLSNIRSQQGDFVMIDSVSPRKPCSDSSTVIRPPSRTSWWYGSAVRRFRERRAGVIDQFIASGEVKWGRICGLVMMLPHGYEGQGPEHSSAHRTLLQLCADNNIQVCVPATPVQMFFLLRRQMIRPSASRWSSSRPRACCATRSRYRRSPEFAESKFKPVNGEWDADIKPESVKRVICCTGKVFFDLMAGRKERGVKDTAIVRIAQLIPFPTTSSRSRSTCTGMPARSCGARRSRPNQGACTGSSAISCGTCARADSRPRDASVLASPAV